jgi:hypothetical protein
MSRVPEAIGSSAADSAITATFATRSEAEAAAETLAESSIPKSAIDIKHEIPPEGARGEAGFLWGVVVAIVLWSIVGAVPGAAFGWLLAELIGPEGTEVMIMYVVCMTILGHLVAGMLAGYALLADRTTAEVLPDQRTSILTVRSVSEQDRHRIEDLLRSGNALTVSATAERNIPRQHVAQD